MRIGIIGTAGRGGDGVRMNARIYEAMLADAAARVGNAAAGEADLVSGGAAWADHLAVSLFLLRAAPRLTLHLPCAFDGTRFVAHGPTSAGGVANHYHARFSSAMGRDTLAELEQARQAGGTLRVHLDGFLARNLYVGRVDMLIAYTWGSGDEPADGGTAHTWRNSKAPLKIHVPLEPLSLPPAVDLSVDL